MVSFNTFFFSIRNCSASKSFELSPNESFSLQVSSSCSKVGFDSNSTGSSSAFWRSRIWGSLEKHFYYNILLRDFVGGPPSGGVFCWYIPVLVSSYHGAWYTGTLRMIEILWYQQYAGCTDAKVCTGTLLLLGVKKQVSTTYEWINGNLKFVTSISVGTHIFDPLLIFVLSRRFSPA